MNGNAVVDETGVLTLDDDVSVTGNLSLTSNSNISDFFDQDECASDEAIKTVFPNGSYECNSISTTTQAEGLSETLASNSTANGSINLSNNKLEGVSDISFGPDESSTVHVISPAKESAANDLKIKGGLNSEITGELPDLILEAGQNGAGVPGDIILGNKFGGAGGRIGIATNSPDAKLDLENGNFDVSGNNIENPSNITNFFNQSKCGSNKAINTIFPNGSYECSQISTATEAENLSKTLARGNEAGNNSINLTGNNLTNVNTVANVENLAMKGSTTSGLSNGDINASDIYYDSTVAKSPVVQCSQGSGWCEVTVPENQSQFFVKKGDKFDKDRPRQTAEKVVESDVETVEEISKLRRKTEKQSQKIKELQSTVSGLKSLVCDQNPEAEVCHPK
jgi:hypothetical protein